MPKTLPLGEIRTDGGTQVRVELDKDTFLDYGRQMAAGVVFPPVDVFHDGAVYWLADGFHRFFGARDNGLTEIAVKIHRGTVRDAILFAIGANATHGKPRSSKDKRHAVEMLLADEDWKEWSNNRLSEIAAVSLSLVNDARNQLNESLSSSQPETTIGKDGKRRRKPKPRKKKLPTPTFVDEEPVEPDELPEPDDEPDDEILADEPADDDEIDREPEADEPAAVYPEDDFADRLRAWCRMQLDNVDVKPARMATVMRRVAKEVGEW